jgi:hypothetical protein
MRCHRITRYAPIVPFLAMCVLLILKPTQAVQRVDYADLTSEQLLATDNIRNNPQDVQIIGDRLIVRIQQTDASGDTYQWQAVFRAVTTFQREATGPHEKLVMTDMINNMHNNWRDQTYWRRRWESHRDQVRGISPELREQLRALPEME